MPVHSLSIDQFRNLAPVTLQLSPRLNLFIGANAAGKTSLLETVFVLGRARSFRSRYLEKLIRNGSERFQLLARVGAEGGRLIPVGISRAEKQLIARIDGQAVKRLSELAALFPIQWVGGNLHRLLEDGPAYRRQFLDWGLFHVKQPYIPAWKRFQRLLKQRNACLRSGRPRAEIVAWDQELAREAQELHQYREAYLGQLQQALVGLTGELINLPSAIELRYRPGWPADQSYPEYLKSSVDRDREQGFTRSGPHRADLVLTSGGQSVDQVLSRGQQKLLVVALHVAQAQVLKQTTGINSLFLLDDLGAELDRDNQAKIINLLVEIEAQVFATAIEPPDLSHWKTTETRVFHVEHGVVSVVL